MKRKPRVTLVRRAGPDHAVLTVSSGGDGSFRHRLSPCHECPWRKDKCGSFPAEAFRLSAPTAYDMSDRTFACHVDGKENPTTCAGFLLRGARHNLSVRFALLRGALDFGKLRYAGHELYESYREMAVANGVDPADPVLQACRE